MCSFAECRVCCCCFTSHTAPETKYARAHTNKQASTQTHPDANSVNVCVYCVSFVRTHYAKNKARSLFFFSVCFNSAALLTHPYTPHARTLAHTELEKENRPEISSDHGCKYKSGTLVRRLLQAIFCPTTLISRAPDTSHGHFLEVIISDFAWILFRSTTLHSPLSNEEAAAAFGWLTLRT